MIGEQVAEAVPRGGVAVHQRLGVREVVRVAALDRIRRERERRAGEADERHAGRRARAVICRIAVEHVAPAPRAVRTGGRPPGRLRCAAGFRSPALRRRRNRTRMPIGSSGSSRSENRIAASTSMRRTGCSVTSSPGRACGRCRAANVARRSSRYSLMYRPAWRMNQTGVASTGWRRQA